METAKAKADSAKAKPAAKPAAASTTKPKPLPRAKLNKLARARKLPGGKLPKLSAKTKTEMAKIVAAKLVKAKAKKEVRKKQKAERKTTEKKAAPSGKPKKPSKKALAIAANIHCRQIFVGNLPETATEKDLMELLKNKNFRSAVRSVRILRCTKPGKRAKKDENGKVIPRSLGAGFIRLKSKTARDAILKEKDWQLEGKTLRLEMAGIKKRHTARLDAQAAAKQKKLEAREEKVKKLKETMNENRLKNIKHKRNLHLKLRRATSKKGNKTAAEKKRIVNLREKLRTKKAKNIVRTERKKLYGIKARKAMVRMSRK